MKKIVSLLSIAIAISCNSHNENNSWIRINFLGYTPESIKNAVFVSKKFDKIDSFEIFDFYSNDLVYQSDSVDEKGSYGPFNTTFRLNFSSLRSSGKYYIKVNNIKSDVFKIDKGVYDGTADFLLKYMRQQRCGFNPYLNEKCHLNDGFIVYHPTKS